MIPPAMDSPSSLISSSKEPQDIGDKYTNLKRRFMELEVSGRVILALIVYFVWIMGWYRNELRADATKTTERTFCESPCH